MSSAWKPSPFSGPFSSPFRVLVTSVLQGFRSRLRYTLWSAPFKCVITVVQIVMQKLNNYSLIWKILIIAMWCMHTGIL